MRMNVYAEEITTRIEVVKKKAEGIEFFGLRIHLLTHENMVPPKHQDDDTSAVTFWFHSMAAMQNFTSLMLHVGSYS